MENIKFSWGALLFNLLVASPVVWYIYTTIVTGKAPFYEGKTFNCALIKDTPTDSFSGTRPYRLHVKEYNCPDGYKVFVE